MNFGYKGIPAIKVHMVKKNVKGSVLPLGTDPSQLVCIRCGSGLKSMLGTEIQIYFCPKCGYRGPIGLEPNIIKTGKKKTI